MTDYRSKAEIFATDFLNYIYEYDILDELDKRTNKMVRSAGVQNLVKQAEAIFPPRIKEGETAPELTDEQRSEAIAAAPNVVDTREMFARRVAKNGGTHALLRQLYADAPGAREAVKEFFEAEDGEKEFATGKEK